MSQPLPTGSALIHVGPFKTGTSSIQHSMRSHRSAMLQAGVLYPGDAYRHLRPAAALLGRSPSGMEKVPIQEWVDLVNEIRDEAPRIAVVSSENLVRANPSAIRRLARDLDPREVHALFVARRLDVLLPSAWQERVKSVGAVKPFEQWLQRVLASGRSTAAERFWGAHGVAGFVQRWTQVLPPDQLHVVIANESDRSWLPSVFSDLLSLPPDLLSKTRGKRPNLRSSPEEVELIRQLNILFRERGWSLSDRRQLVLHGVARNLRPQAEAEEHARTAQFTHEELTKVRERSLERKHEILDAARTGVDVIGDADNILIPDSITSARGRERPVVINVEQAVQAISGLAMQIENLGYLSSVPGHEDGPQQE